MASATATLTPSPAMVRTASQRRHPRSRMSCTRRRSAIAYVTVNRPKVLNALNTPTWRDLRTAFETARDDATVRGVILTGAGNKAFIAGADSAGLRISRRSRPSSRAVSDRRCSISSKYLASR